MSVTQSQLQSDLAKVSQESSSEHSKFSTRNLPIINYGNIFLPYNEKTEKLVAGLNKINFDLSKHPTANKLVNLPQESVDNLVAGLNHDARMAEQYTK